MNWDNLTEDTLEIYALRAESPFSGKRKSDSSRWSSRSVGDGAEVKAVVLYAGPEVS